MIFFALVPIFILSCQKEGKQLPVQEEIETASNNNKEHGHLQQTKTFSADVVKRWLNMQLEMLRVPAPAGVLAPVSGRALAYCGIALYEAVEPGMGSNDAGTIGFIKKYQVNLVRPITYIRNVMGHTSWNALFNTPGHPEFPSAHALNGGVISVMLTDVLGENFELTLDHYNYLGLPARHYASFDALGKEMGDSRVFGGIHYQASCDKGFWLGKKVSQNILSKVKFLKE